MSVMVSCVKNNHGYVDKFIGDAIMATWGTLSATGDHPLNAIKAALDMREALKKYNKKRGSAKKPKLHFGIGINYGSVVSGQIGSQEKMEYTVIGDVVNIASRIEGITKEFGIDIIVSETIYANTKKDYNYISLQIIQVKGKAKPIQLYALLGSKKDKNCPQNLDELRDSIGYRKPTK